MKLPTGLEEMEGATPETPDQGPAPVPPPPPPPTPDTSFTSSRAGTGSNTREEESSFIRRSLEALGQYRPNVQPQPVPLEVVPHTQAPLFLRPDWKEILQNALGEVVSTNAISPEMHEVIRQAGLSSLWFYGKYIAGQDGPYDLLTNHLHIDMCNFRQRLLYPAARGAMVIFRGGYKTAIGAELATAWELHRDPNLTVKLTGASEDRAFSYFESVKTIFESDSNEFYYPESHVNPKKVTRSRRWNNDRLIVPNQTKRRRDPSLQYGGVGGKSAGIHVDLHVIDDPVEFTDLNAGRLSATDMYKITNWIWANEKSLLFDMHTSRIMFNGTRYAVDDTVSTILPKVGAFYGYPLDGFQPNPQGTWIFYYRKAIEDGVITFPESMTYDGLVEMAETDWWTFATQYLNDPQNTGIAEFSQYKVGLARVEYVESMDEYFVELPSYGSIPRRWALSECDVTQSTDPAGTEKYVSSKTSRSVVGLLARTPDDEYVFLNVRAGYISTFDMFNIMFENMETYGQWIRASFLEQQGAFKALDSLLTEEENRRKRWLSKVAVTATGDKDATIRTTLQPLLAQGKIYADDRSVDMIMEEVRSFPSSRKKDILDMMKIAVRGSVKPLTESERNDEEEYENRWRNRRRSVTGYGG